MAKECANWKAWEVKQLTLAYPSIRIVPTRFGGLRINGSFVKKVSCPNGQIFDLEYNLKIVVPPNFPSEIPKVSGVENELHPDWEHYLGDHTKKVFCLGSPLEVLMLIQEKSTLLGFVEKVIFPYLANHEAFKSDQPLPFGELEHYSNGLIVNYEKILSLKGRPAVLEMLRLLGKKRRVANKKPCPCESGKRLGKCHAVKLGPLRRQLATLKFRDCLLHLTNQMTIESENHLRRSPLKIPAGSHR